MLRAHGVRWSPFGQTRRLALSVSHSSNSDSLRRKIFEEDRKPTEREEQVFRSAGECNARNIVQFLSAFPNLEELELQWYSFVHYAPNPGHQVERDFLPQVNSTIHWPNLQSCTLKGFRTTKEPLLAFFKRHPQLTSVTIEGLWLPPHQKRQLWPLMQHFARRGSKLEYLRLSEIWKERRVFFEDGNVWPGKRARQRIKCQLDPRGPAPACIENIWEIAERGRRYGPP